MIQSSDQSDQAPLLRGEEEEEDERWVPIFISS